MTRYVVPIVAAALAMMSLAAYAKDVNLAPRDNVELGQRGDGRKSESAIGRTRDERAQTDLRPDKRKTAKAKKKKLRKRDSKRP